MEDAAHLTHLDLGRLDSVGIKGVAPSADALTPSNDARDSRR